MENEPKDLEELQERARAGERPNFVFFWGHTPGRSGEVGFECFSQWYPAPFEVDGVRFATAEHFMMAGKARLFEDRAAEAQILAAPTPAEVKRLGREVKGFNEATWNERRFGIVVRGNIEKFSQNPALREVLLRTTTDVLVEASPTDSVWGIGLAASDERARDPLAWRGLNLLGFALMRARAHLMSGDQLRP